MIIKDEQVQIREKIEYLKKAQEGVGFRRRLARTNLNKLDNSIFVSTDKLRVANWEYDHQSQVLNLLDEYNLLLLDKLNNGAE